MNYVMHFCRNKNCNNGWIDKDLTHATTIPPKWKYCKECAKKKGIDFENQKPNDYRTPEQIEKMKEKMSQIRAQLTNDFKK